LAGQAELTHLLSGVVVPDSSIVIKWFRQSEADAEQAEALRQAHLEGQLLFIVPDLLLYEIANVLRFKSDLDEAAVRSAVRSLTQINLEISPITEPRLQQVIALAYQHEITVYDASFITLAEETGGDFVTTDEKLLKKVSALPFCHALANVTIPGGE
jgi:predicted nucleic acid-binding protein